MDLEQRLNDFDKDPRRRYVWVSAYDKPKYEKLRFVFERRVSPVMDLGLMSQPLCHPSVQAARWRDGHVSGGNPHARRVVRKG